MVTIRILKEGMFQIQPSASVRFKRDSQFRVREELAQEWEAGGRVEIVTAKKA